MERDALKRRAAERALALLAGVRVLGLGSGSTAELFIRAVGERRRSGDLQELSAIPTSVRTEELARELGIPLTTLDAHPEIDLTVDGADEVDPHLNLIKGLGGALTREKIVAHASRRYIIIVDESKRVERLGMQAPLPVEVLQFARVPVERALARLGGEPTVRLQGGGEPFITDEGNVILDCHFPGGIKEPEALDRVLNALPGVVEHGLFLDMADQVIVASGSDVQLLER